MKVQVEIDNGCEFTLMDGSIRKCNKGDIIEVRSEDAEAWFRCNLVSYLSKPEKPPIESENKEPAPVKEVPTKAHTKAPAKRKYKRKP